MRRFDVFPCLLFACPDRAVFPDPGAHAGIWGGHRLGMTLGGNKNPLYFQQSGLYQGWQGAIWDNR